MSLPSRQERLWKACRGSTFVRWQLEFARRAAEAENASIMLLDEEGRHLVFAHVVGEHAEKYLGGEGGFEAALRVPVDSGIGISPLAVLYGKPICMNETDPRHNPDIDLLVGTRTRSLYAIPLASAEEVLGTFGAINAHGGGPGGFGREDREALDAAAEAIALWLRREWAAIAPSSGEASPGD